MWACAHSNVFFGWPRFHCHRVFELASVVPSGPCCKSFCLPRDVLPCRMVLGGNSELHVLVVRRVPASHASLPASSSRPGPLTVGGVSAASGVGGWSLFSWPRFLRNMRFEWEEPCVAWVRRLTAGPRLRRAPRPLHLWLGSVTWGGGVHGNLFARSLFRLTSTPLQHAFRMVPAGAEPRSKLTPVRPTRGP